MESKPILHSDHSHSTPKWTNDDKAKALNAAAFICFLGVAIAAAVERSFWCHQKICNDFVSLKDKREICNWTELTLSLVGMALSTISVIYFSNCCKKSSQNRTDEYGS
ncbi:MAG: hypothetical protein K1000chlam2_00063 [Chlamydiae bacterium]|nr:hypothetical protein [Chlamydiota bacterium]